MRKHKYRLFSALAILALALCLLAGCGGKKSGEVTSLEQLARPGCRIGVASDTAEDQLVAQVFPQAQIKYFKDDMAAYTSVAQGKLDAYVYGRDTMETAIQNGLSGVRLLEESLGEGNKGAVALSPKTKIPNLEEQVNTFLDQIKADGTLAEIEERWIKQQAAQMPEIPTPEQAELHLTVGTTGSNPPFTFYSGTELAGYDVELAYRFAAWLGATLEFKVYDYDGIVPAAQSGDVDCIFANLFVTPERTQEIRFSHPTHIEEIAVMVREPDAPDTSGDTVRWQDYNGKKLGVLVGPLMEDTAAEFFPDSEYLLYNTYPDCIAALLAGKIDGYLSDEPGVKSTHAEQPEIDYIHERLTENNYSFAFRKDDPKSAALCAELDEFLTRCWADGTMEELDEIWLGADEARKTVDMSGLTGENGTIRVVTTSTDMPWSYIKDGKNVGYDIDLVVRFCRDRGYGLELGDVDFSGRIPAIQSGKYDFTTDMNVTPEREEQVLFSKPTSQGGIVLAVRASDLAAPASGGEIGGPEGAAEPVDLEHAAIGVDTGSIFPDILGAYLPEAEIHYFNNIADELSALKSRKIDAIALDEPVARSVQAMDSAVAVAPEIYGSFDFAYMFAKNEHGAALCEALNEYMNGLKEDGTLEALQRKWFDCEDLSAVETTDYQNLPDTNGTIHLGTNQYQPFVLAVDGQYGGYEIEILAMFCRDQGYALDISDMSSDALLSAVWTGKCDVGCGGMSITEERKQNLYFSQPNYSGGVKLLVMKQAGAGDGSFLSSVKDSFHKTFIRENRWKLFVAGICTTLLVTSLSVLFGTVLGFGVFLLCRKGNPVANRITRFFVWLVQGMPVVVLLMILYYIIFGQVTISGVAVSVVGFTLVFGSAVFAMAKAGVATVDRGQTEAAYALGYTDRKAFFRVVLPQALPHFMPAYKGEITALIKATAVVGYVAVQDLTKMGDIVRSRTYEAFFPLIAVAVIYFILAGLLTFFVSRIELHINPRRRSRESILKGVQQSRTAEPKALQEGGDGNGKGPDRGD